MLIRREDFKEINKLTKGSHKKIWFVCDNCGIGVLRSYKNYNKNDEDLCRTCQNKKTSNREDVRRKNSEFSKNRWKDSQYREKMSRKLSQACKKAWDKDDGSRKNWISQFNPMKYEYVKKKVAESESVSDEDIEKFLNSIGYTFLYKELGKRGGAIVHFVCDNGHTSFRRLDALKHGGRCKYCNVSSSQGEKELQDFVFSLLGEECEFNDRTLISPYELDIIIPSKRIAIEYCGVYWHSESQGRGKEYHLSKLNWCSDRGYELITIFEDEWVNKKDIVKKRLEHKLGFSGNRIYARKCEVKQITTKEAKEFCNSYHIQGYGNSSVKLGLFYENELVSVMTFSKPSISKGTKEKIEDVRELNRFCSKYPVIGGFSKLLNYFCFNYEWNYIFSYVDRRWNNGITYVKNGFDLEKYTKPNYWYTKTINNEIVRYHRFNFRKSMLKERGTEKEVMMRNGWNVIWDCGNIKFILENKRPR